MYAIKCRKKGERAWYFLVNGGGLNRLRVHALTWASRIDAEVLSEILKAEKCNAGYEVKVVEF